VLSVNLVSIVLFSKLRRLLAFINSLQSKSEASIAICSDSPAALKALKSAKNLYRLVAEMMKALKQF